MTLRAIGDAVLSTDLDGRVTYLNRAAEAMTGWPLEEAKGRRLDQVFHIIDGATREPAPDPMRLAVQLEKAVGLTPNCILVCRGGREVAIEDSAAPIRDRDGQVTGAVIVFRDVGTALATSRQMASLAQHDWLTGLPNRVLLHDRLTAAIALGHRRHKLLAVFFVDVDGFKKINDSVGHAAADEVLRSIATRLAGVLRRSDTVTRLGGDEFVVVLPEIEHAEDAGMLAAKVLETLAQPHSVGARDVALTAGLGVSLFPAHGQDADTLLEHADAAMYEAKRSGPGTYRLFDPATSERPTPTGAG
jgi:diguanylate cyclase (GGDEF)-like protein/PAS domain S-box-containing protein